MNGKYKRIAALAAAVLLTIGAVGCATQNGQEGVSQPAAEGAEASELAVVGSEWDEASAAKITLADNGIQVDGAGAEAQGSTLTISAGGVYVLSGSLSDGQVVVAAGEADVVRLVLGGVDIACSTSAAIDCRSAEDLIVTLAKDSENTLSDAAEYVYETAGDDEPDAALFSKCDLILNGSGSLTVNGNYNNGIGTKDDLTIESGSYTVTAVNHGVRGRDSVTVVDGSLTIHAGNDGIQSNYDTDEQKGWVILAGGTFEITAAHDGVQAETALTVTGGEYRIVTGGGADAEIPVVTDETASDSYKGLKAGGAVTISGGAFKLDCADDAIHSNGDILISGGSFAIATGDDGVHADGDLTVSDGAITITKSYEGLEAKTMTISGGAIDLVADDDGINVAGGNDGAGGGRFGPDRFAQGSEDQWLKITGGAVHISAQGDGIDINGSGEMTGGEVVIDGPTGGGDSALDYDGSFFISGGTLVGAGSSGMAMAPGSDSQQPSLMLYFTEAKPENTAVELSDAQGNAVLSYMSDKSFQCILFSAPGLEDGSAYTIIVGGEKLPEVTLSGAVTAVDQTGAAVSGGMMGGRGGMGGGRGGMTPPNGEMPQRPTDGEMPEYPQGEPPQGQRSAPEAQTPEASQASA